MDTRCTWEETVVGWKDIDNEKWVRYDDKTITQGEVENMYIESRLGGAPQTI